MLITEHVALKVGQEEGALHPQSQLEPWSQIKRLLVADGGNMALARQHKVILKYIQTPNMCFMHVCMLAQPNVIFDSSVNILE